MTNTATATNGPSDPNPANNAATASTTVTGTTGGPADLALTMTDSPDPVGVGGDITYALTLRNNGPSTATGVVITDTQPPGVTLVSATGPGGPCTQSGSTVTCPVGTLAPGASASANIVVRTSAPGAVTNTATATATSPDPNTSDNTATTTTTVIAASSTADVALTILDNPDPVPAGNLLTYNITAVNNGPSTAIGVVVTNPLPPNTVFFSATPSQGTCSFSNGVVTCNLGNLAPGAAANIALLVRPTTPGTLTDTATVATTGSVDPTSGNNSATATTTITTGPAPTDADLAVTLTDSPDPIGVGGNLTYTATVRNIGPAAAVGSVLTLPLPPGTTFVSATPTQGTCTATATTITCALGTVPPGAAPTVAIIVRPTTPGTVTATGAVTSTTNDPNIENNTATTTTTVVPSVPTMSEVGLIALMLLLGGIGVWSLRKYEVRS